jgi:hypothetical protein
MSIMPWVKIVRHALRSCFIIQLRGFQNDTSALPE